MALDYCKSQTSFNELSRLSKRIVSSVERFATHLEIHLEKRWMLWWIGFSAVYLFFAMAVAKTRLFWFDELFTYYLGQLPPSKIWGALVAGLDQNSPVFFLLSAATRNLTKTPELGLRIPEIVGVWAMLLGVFLYVRKRASVLWGWVAVLFIVSTHAVFYAVEARPYGLVLACSAWSFFAWHQAGEPRRSWWCIPLLGLSLTIAGLSHAYAILLFLPLGLGELTLVVQRRKIDTAVWIALVAPALVFAVYVPMMRLTKELLPINWAKPDLWKLPESYMAYFDPMWSLMFALLVVLALWALFSGRNQTNSSSLPFALLPLHESVALMALVLLPVWGLAIGRLVTGLFTPRYAMACVVGVGILFALLSSRVGTGRVLLPLSLCLTCVTWEIGSFGHRLSTIPTGRRFRRQTSCLRWFAITPRC